MAHRQRVNLDDYYCEDDEVDYGYEDDDYGLEDEERAVQESKKALKQQKKEKKSKQRDCHCASIDVLFVLL